MSGAVAYLMFLARILRKKIKIHQPKLEENRRLKMAERRMFTKKVTDDDNFMALSSSAQALYLHLSMSADDDGFCNQVSVSMFKAHASVADLQQLLEKRYIYQFDNGVIVIKHWRMANALRKDRYTPTNFKEELAKLKIKSNGAYTFSDDGCRVVANGLPDGCQVVATCLPQDSIGKVSIDKNSIVKDSKDKEKDIDKSISKKKTVYYPDDAMLESAFQEYLTMRKKIKKPICTEMALHRAMNTIERLSKGDNDLAVKILNQSVDHCWQGLFALKDNEPHSTNKGAIDWDNV